MSDFKEILKPSYRGNDKVVLKINGNISFNKAISGVNNLYSLINKFGSIDYVYNGVSYSESGDFSLISSNKADSNDYYIEVDKNILNASSIKLSFNFRNYKSSYVLRGDVDA